MFKKVLKELLIFLGLFVLLLIVSAGVLAGLIGNKASLIVFLLGWLIISIRPFKKAIVYAIRNYKEQKKNLAVTNEEIKSVIIEDKKTESPVLQVDSDVENNVALPAIVEKEKIMLPILETKPAIHDKNSITIANMLVHNDLQGLLWIADGRHKNYKKVVKKENQMEFYFGERRLLLTLHHEEEPSLVYTRMRIKEVEDISSVPRPPYYPSYKDLSPEQKWVYLNLLTNPYNPNIDVGFVFILYYGLERHLLLGDIEQAFRIILKLRDVHNNNSFQHYSATALILSAMLRERGDLVEEFIASLDKDYEFNFPHNLFLLCYYSFNIPVQARDIMRMAKTFEWTNLNYIKKQTDLFLESLSQIIKERHGGKDFIILKDLVTEKDLQKLKTGEHQMFANMSIIDHLLDVPKMDKLLKLRKEMHFLLEKAHNTTKAKLAEMRKLNRQKSK